MILIPGFLIAAVTFPGVIIHELGHLLFCKLTRVGVLEVCYFRFGNPSGYVLHEPVHSPGKNLLIAFGPLFLNTLLGALIAMPVMIPVFHFNAHATLLDFFLIYLGVSIAMHSFPSTGDAQSLWQALWVHGNIGTKLIALPVVGVLYIGALGSVFWLDVIYGVAVVFMIPDLLIKALA